MTMRLDKKLLRPAEQIPRRHRARRCTAARSTRACFSPTGRTWIISCCRRALGGLHRHTGVEEVYYVINGDGEVSVGGETTAIRKGDAVPLQLNDPHAFRNTGKADLEFMILGHCGAERACSTCRRWMRRQIAARARRGNRGDDWQYAKTADCVRLRRIVILQTVLTKLRVSAASNRESANSAPTSAPGTSSSHCSARSRP